ncbi:hypothetical protein [Rhodococcus sp. KRD162]|jgi:hypothetical protein|uniref:Uncharacterized protein n=1 Tax=Rhodococcus baikonurensis TaxID=172041 RepID=A0ABV5XS63_9NOCA|nr:hypothetical protein [Rhodococcus sp. KRD162]
MRHFRVYNRVRAVGVTFPVAGNHIGIGSAAILGVVVAATAALAAFASFVAGTIALGFVIFIGFVILLTAFFAIVKLTQMGNLREGTQLSLIRDAMRERRIKNFQTPDVGGDINDDFDLLTDSNSVYRNH